MLEVGQYCGLERYENGSYCEKYAQGRAPDDSDEPSAAVSVRYRLALYDENDNLSHTSDWHSSWSECRREVSDEVGWNLEAPTPADEGGSVASDDAEATPEAGVSEPEHQLGEPVTAQPTGDPQEEDQCQAATSHDQKPKKCVACCCLSRGDSTIAASTTEAVLATEPREEPERLSPNKDTITPWCIEQYRDQNRSVVYEARTGDGERCFQLRYAPGTGSIVASTWHLTLEDCREELRTTSGRQLERPVFFGVLYGRGQEPPEDTDPRGRTDTMNPPLSRRFHGIERYDDHTYSRIIEGGLRWARTRHKFLLHNERDDLVAESAWRDLDTCREEVRWMTGLPLANPRLTRHQPGLICAQQGAGVASGEALVPLDRTELQRRVAESTKLQRELAEGDLLRRVLESTERRWRIAASTALQRGLAERDPLRRVIESTERRWEAEARIRLLEEFEKFNNLESGLTPNSSGPTSHRSEFPSPRDEHVERLDRVQEQSERPEGTGENLCPEAHHQTVSESTKSSRAGASQGKVGTSAPSL